MRENENSKLKFCKLCEQGTAFYFLPSDAELAALTCIGCSANLGVMSGEHVTRRAPIDEHLATEVARALQQHEGSQRVDVDVEVTKAEGQRWKALLDRKGMQTTMVFSRQDLEESSAFDLALAHLTRQP